MPDCTLAELLRPTFSQCRCKKIGEAGSQQLLLDTQAIKGLLLELPTAGIRTSALLRIFILPLQLVLHLAKSSMPQYGKGSSLVKDLTELNTDLTSPWEP